MRDCAVMASAVLKYALIGSPIAHSLSPAMQSAAFVALGIEATYEAIEARLEDAAAVTARLRGSSYAGWNVTTPLKEATLPYVDRLTESAQAVRAINVVRKEADGSLSGHNTDGAGLLRALRELPNWNAAESAVLILGSGPAARSIAAALRGTVAELYCWSRNAQNAAAIAAPLQGNVDLLISALPPRATVPSEIFTHVTPQTKVLDINYGTTDSPVAQLRGDRFYSGVTLLLHQGALSFEWWTGRPAPLDVMRAALYGGA